VERAQAFKEDVAVELGDITDLRFPDNHFDAYILWGAFIRITAVSSGNALAAPGSNQAILPW
jgi:ubiquinone/menaquinone biosynthesis C-methylase UbiE